jgi:Cytochrome c, mono- and diheme variants
LLQSIIFYLSSPANKAEASISLLYENLTVVGLGKSVYVENCASCHGLALEGQANWRQSERDGYLPAPPHDETGHTGITLLITGKKK